MPRPLYLGLISGTSLDGIDAVIASFEDERLDLLAACTTPYAADLAEGLGSAVRSPETLTIDDIGQLDTRVGEAFASAAMRIAADAGIAVGDIEAIGSHGQTLRHRPDAAAPFTWQLGDPGRIAAETGLVTVGDFRRQDLALGGQGAPLVPPFHAWLFADPLQQVAVLNAGGIANLTLLPQGADVSGFDTGPANTLMDNWVRRHLAKPYDADGEWAKAGTVHPPLLEAMRRDPYFAAPPPKSTGFEYFNAGWLEQFGVDALNAADVQATLLELSVTTIADALERAMPQCTHLIVCGGGASNAYFLARLDECLSAAAVSRSTDYGLAPEWVEATAFAWLARERLAGRPGNLPTVTGAKQSSPLGGVYLPPSANEA